MENVTADHSRELSSRLRPKTIRIDSTRTGHTPILNGPPETATMRSGAVVLPSGKAVGQHTTGEREEVIVVLAGSGELRLGNGDRLQLEAQSVTYCPPATEHDVVNTGVEALRYVYIVASAGQRP